MFLAFAYFLVGQAAVTRNSAQTAADAAALAAAQEARDRLREGWLDVILDPAQWGDFIEGKAGAYPSACQQAAAFAARNGASLSGEKCVHFTGEREGFEVTVRTAGAEKWPAVASASAVIEAQCDFAAPEAPASEEPEPSPDPTEPGEEPEPDPITGLTCNGEALVIDPGDPKLPSAADLFAVRLVGGDE